MGTYQSCWKTITKRPKDFCSHLRCQTTVCFYGGGRRNSENTFDWELIELISSLLTHVLHDQSGHEGYEHAGWLLLELGHLNNLLRAVALVHQGHNLVSLFGKVNFLNAPWAGLGLGLQDAGVQ